MKVTSDSSIKEIHREKQMALSSISPISFEMSPLSNYTIDFMGVVNRIESSSIDEYIPIGKEVDQNISNAIISYKVPTIPSLEAELTLFSLHNQEQGLSKKILSQFKESSTKIVITEVTKLIGEESILTVESNPLHITIKEYLLLLEEVPLNNEIQIKSFELDSSGKIRYLELEELHQI